MVDDEKVEVRDEVGDELAEGGGELAMVDDMERLLETASGSFDDVVDMCEKMVAAERMTRAEMTRQRLRGHLALAEDTFKKAQKLAEYRLRGYRLIGDAWRSQGEKRGRPKKNPEPGGFPTAAELGVDARRLNEYSMASEVPEDQFDAYLADANDKGLEVTLSGLIRISRAMRKLVRNKKLAEEHEAAAEEIGEDDQIIYDLGVERLAGQFRTIYADPPWGYEDEARRGAAAHHYPTMGIDQLCEEYAEQIKALANSGGAHMWLWATWPKLRDGWPQHFLRECGFEWKSEVVWDKIHQGPGRWIMKKTEVLILGVRGKCGRRREDLMDLVSIQKDQKHHSRKPREFCELIESFSPGPYLELFARDVVEDDRRDGWWYHGYEVDGCGVDGSGVDGRQVDGCEADGDELRGGGEVDGRQVDDHGSMLGEEG